MTGGGQLNRDPWGFYTLSPDRSCEMGFHALYLMSQDDGDRIECSQCGWSREAECTCGDDYRICDFHLPEGRTDHQDSE